MREAGRNSAKMGVEKKGRIGGERDEKRKGGGGGEGNHSSETHGCGMAYYRSNV